MSWPSTRTQPEVIGRKPAIARSTSDFPDLGGPRNVKNSPYRTWTPTSWTPGGRPPRVLSASRRTSTSGRLEPCVALTGSSTRAHAEPLGHRCADRRKSVRRTQSPPSRVAQGFAPRPLGYSPDGLSELPHL